MTATTELRLFRLIVAIATVVPIAAGAAGVLRGPQMIHGGIPSSPDLESHFRYLSGLLLGIGLGFLFTIGDVRKRAALFRCLGLIVLAGGLARLLGAFEEGLPATPQRFALVMELGVVPLLLIWHLRVVRRPD